MLWLEAPLQSWGADSKFGRRDTLAFPTKSGVAGLLLCALGASGEQRELLFRLAPLRQTVVSYARTDREPLLRDFHMVGSGYDESDPWESLLIPRTSDGGKAVGGGTKLTYRYYLQDARFAVVLELPDDLAKPIADALQNPVYDLYLGRKNCVPTDFVYRGTFAHEEAALKRAHEIAQDKGLAEDFRVVDGGDTDKGDVLTLNDVPVQFGDIKRYTDRRVTVIRNG
ncbi:MAG: type I-E CRISPR-associated protein Cas5/CasD [Selenomonadales bacterium]|nr:type I-E CRISPR-associated protein Cas5/CasD [Selenomonadales bacterium]